MVTFRGPFLLPFRLPFWVQIDPTQTPAQQQRAGTTKTLRALTLREPSGKRRQICL
jgi:hypothetical protein